LRSSCKSKDGGARLLPSFLWVWFQHELARQEPRPTGTEPNLPSAFDEVLAPFQHAESGSGWIGEHSHLAVKEGWVGIDESRPSQLFRFRDCLRDARDAHVRKPGWNRFLTRSL